MDHDSTASFPPAHQWMPAEPVAFPACCVGALRGRWLFELDAEVLVQLAIGVEGRWR